MFLELAAEFFHLPREIFHLAGKLLEATFGRFWRAFDGLLLLAGTFGFGPRGRAAAIIQTRLGGIADSGPGRGRGAIEVAPDVGIFMMAAIVSIAAIITGRQWAAGSFGAWALAAFHGASGAGALGVNRHGAIGAAGQWPRMGAGLTLIRALRAAIPIGTIRVIRAFLGRAQFIEGAETGAWRGAIRMTFPVFFDANVDFFAMSIGAAFAVHRPAFAAGFGAIFATIITGNRRPVAIGLPPQLTLKPGDFPFHAIDFSFGTPLAKLPDSGVQLL